MSLIFSRWIPALALLSSLLFASTAFPQTSGIALVYKGPGACDDGCWQAAALSGERMGLTVHFVGPNDNDPSIFVGAKVWIQPGGFASTYSKKMSPELKDNIRAFVRSGGGYVGYCAGAFFATAEISNRKVEGLGILPGRNRTWEENTTSPEQVMITWNGQQRDLYWEGGPYFILSDNDPVQVTATYPNGAPVSVRAKYGRGRVYVTGVHPEGTPDWRTDAKPALVDTDGMDYDLTDEMIGWVMKSRKHPKTSDGE